MREKLVRVCMLLLVAGAFLLVLVAPASVTVLQQDLDRNPRIKLGLTELPGSKYRVACLFTSRCFLTDGLGGADDVAHY